MTVAYHLRCCHRKWAMEKLESFLKRLLNNVNHEGCLIKKGQIVYASDPFFHSLDLSDIREPLEAGGGVEREWTHRRKEALYTLKLITFDDVYSVILLKKIDEFNLAVDSLTGLLHRATFEKLPHQLLEEARVQNRVLAFLFLDLDGFKAVNDNWGHESGDLVLKESAERILKVIREDDFCFRIGGDEFVVILTSIKDRMHSCLVARRLIASISKPVDITPAQQVQIGVSIGIASYPLDGSKVEELTQRADEAMYKAKKLGKNNYQLYR